MKHLLTLILFISTSTFADVCNVDILIDKPTYKIYQDETNEIAAKCKLGDTLSMELAFANKAAVVSKHLIFATMSSFCDLSKSIEYDLSGLNFNLVCAFKKN